MAAKFYQTFVVGSVKSSMTQRMTLSYCYRQFRCIISYSNNDETEIRMSTLLEDYGVTIKPGSNLEHWMISQERNASKYDVPAVKQRLDYLTSLGIKKEDMVKPLNKRPWVLKHDMKQMDRNVTFLESLGIRGDSLARVLTSVPQVLSLQVDTLQQRVEHLKNSGFSDTDVVRLIKRYPSSLTSCLESVVPTKMRYLQETIGLDNEETIILMCKRPYLMGMKLEKIATRIHFLTSTVGLNKEQLKKGILTGPGAALLTLSEEAMKIKLDYYRNTMGVSTETIVKQPGLLTFSLARVVTRYRFLLHVGFTNENLPPFLSLIIPNDERFVKMVTTECSLTEYCAFKDKVILDMESSKTR